MSSIDMILALKLLSSGFLNPLGISISSSIPYKTSSLSLGCSIFISGYYSCPITSVSTLGLFFFFGFRFIASTSSFSSPLLMFRFTPFISSILSRLFSKNRLGVSPLRETSDISELFIAFILLPCFLLGERGSADFLAAYRNCLSLSSSLGARKSLLLKSLTYWSMC